MPTLHNRRITVISQLPPPVHGVTVVTRALLHALQEAGASVGFVDRRFSRTVAEVGHFKLRKVTALGSYWFRYLREVIWNRPDAVILFGTTRKLSFLTDLGVILISRVLRIPLVNYVHSIGYRGLAKQRFYKPLVRYALGSFDATVCLGPTLTQDVDQWTRPSTTQTICNATDLQESSRIETRRQLLFMSNLIPEKGVEAFLQLAVELSLRYADLTCVLAGAILDERDHAKQVSRLRALGLHERIRFAGVVTGDSKKQLLSESTALIFPSQYPLEAQPLTIIEAMSFGLPVVAFDTGGIRDLVQHGATGCLVEAGDIDALIHHTEAVLTNPTMRASFRREALRHHASAHSPHVYRESWVQLLGQLTSKAP